MRTRSHASFPGLRMVTLVLCVTWVSWLHSGVFVTCELSNPFPVTDIPTNQTLGRQFRYAANATIRAVPIGDYNNDMHDDIVVQVSNGGSGTLNIVLGQNVTAGGLSADNDFAINSAETSFPLNGAVVGAGDIDHDGFDDVLASDDGEDAKVVILFGTDNPTSGNVRLDESGGENAGNLTNGVIDSPSASFGASMIGGGRVNDDNFDDFAIGAPQSNEVFLMFGTDTDMWRNPFNTSSLTGTNGVRLYCSNSSLICGQQVVFADVDCDGLDDVLISVTVLPDKGKEFGNDNTGEIRVIRGNTVWPAQMDIMTEHSMVIRSSGNATFPGSMARVGHVCGTTCGRNDVLIGERRVTASGLSAHAFLVCADNKYAKGTTVLDVYDSSITRFATQSAAVKGREVVVSGLGDVNSDGEDDMVFGLPESPNGHVVVVYGKESGFVGGSTVSLDTVEDDVGVRFDSGASPTAFKLGNMASVMGDWNNDGIADMLLVGHQDPANRDPVIIVYGQVSPTDAPTAAPTQSTQSPTMSPSPAPSLMPTQFTTDTPSTSPTETPTPFTFEPTTLTPTAAPAMSTDSPTPAPTQSPSQEPTQSPSPNPTPQPTFMPTAMPTPQPTIMPTAMPTPEPTVMPTAMPTPMETPSPTATASPTPFTPTTPSPTQSPVTSAPTSTSPPTPSPTAGCRSDGLVPEGATCVNGVLLVAQNVTVADTTTTMVSNSITVTGGASFTQPAGSTLVFTANADQSTTVVIEGSGCATVDGNAVVAFASDPGTTGSTSVITLVSGDCVMGSFASVEAQTDFENVDCVALDAGQQEATPTSISVSFPIERGCAKSSNKGLLVGLIVGSCVLAGVLTIVGVVLARKRQHQRAMQDAMYGTIQMG